MTTIFVWILVTVSNGHAMYSPPVATQESCLALKAVTDGEWRNKEGADKHNQCIRVEIPK